MPDFGSPVAQNVNVNPTQGIATISGMLGLKQQRLALETGQFQKATAEAEATGKGIAAQGATEAAGFMKDFDFSKHIGPDGTLDMNAALSNPKFQKAGPGKELIANALLGIKNNQIKNKQEMATLNANVVSAGSRMFGDLVSDPDVIAGNDKGLAKINSHADVFKEMFPDQGPAFIDKFLKVVNDGHVKPEDRAQALRALQLQGEDVSAQQAQQNPVLGSQVGPNGELVGTVQNRVTGAMQTAAGGVPLGLSPQQLAQTITLPNGQVTTLGQFIGHGQGGQPHPAGPTQTGAPMPPGQAQHPRTAMQDAPPPNAPKAVQDAFYTAVKGANDHVASVRSSDENYGLNMRISDQIRSLSKTTTSGPGAGALHHVMGVLGLPFGSDNVADYQLMGAYLDRQAATMRTAMGLPSTNEGIQTSQAITGNAEYQSKALQDKNDLTQALSEGFHQYRNGLDRVAGFSGQASPQAVSQFKNAWTNAFDPNVYRGELAYKRSKKDGDAFVASLDPKEAASLKQKRATLNSLARGQMQ